MSTEIKTYGDYKLRTAEVVIEDVKFVVKELPQAPLELLLPMVADAVEKFFEALTAKGDGEKAKDASEVMETVASIGVAGFVRVVSDVFIHRLPEVVFLALTWTLPGREDDDDEVFGRNLAALPETYTRDLAGMRKFLRRNCGLRQQRVVLEALLDVLDIGAVVGEYRGLFTHVLETTFATTGEDRPETTDGESSIPSSVH